jgi:biopolymer transport protein ExbB
MANPILNFFFQGGPVFMVPLTVLSVLSLAIILERVHFYGRRVMLGGPGFGELGAALSKGEYETARRLCGTGLGLPGLIAGEAIGIFLSRGKKEPFRRAMEDGADRHIDMLAKRLWMLRAIGHIAPLIGLLGTVVGLTLAFGNIAEAGLSQQSVARGIAMALITTITGLSIGIPTFFAEYCLRAWSESRYRGLKILLEDLVAAHEQHGDAQ